MTSINMNPIESFEMEKKAAIQKMANDPNMRSLTHQWFVESVKHRYSYNYTWMGRPVIQYPEDLLAMQEIVWRTKPDLIVETGVAHGGSIIFYASMLELIGGDGQVLGIDVEIRKHNRLEIEKHPMFKRIMLIEGSSIDEEVIRKVHDVAQGRKRVLVALDSNHTHDHVLRELQAYSSLVKKDGYLVVFDTVVEELPDELWNGRPVGRTNNPKTAVWQFLETNDRFIVDKDVENKLLITVAPDGYLRCIRD